MKDKLDRIDNRSSFSSGFFLGAILGAAGIFLFASKKGKKLREYLREHGQGILEDLEEIYEEVQEKEFTQGKIDAPKAQIQPEPGKEKDLGHIKKLQERGRDAVRFFKRDGKALK